MTTPPDDSCPETRGNISAAEWEMRVDLAAAFRIAYHLGWNDRLVNHISRARSCPCIAK